MPLETLRDSWIYLCFFWRRSARRSDAGGMAGGDDEFAAARAAHAKQQERLARQMEKDAALREVAGTSGASGWNALLADGAHGRGSRTQDGAGALTVAAGPGAYERHLVYLKSKRPLMSKVKEVVEYIVGAKKVVSSVDILEALKYDLNTDERVLEELRLHPQIKVTEAGGGDAHGERRLFLLSYVPTFDVRSRAELLQALERLPEGTAVKVPRNTATTTVGIKFPECLGAWVAGHRPLSERLTHSSSVFQFALSLLVVCLCRTSSGHTPV